MKSCVLLRGATMRRARTAALLVLAALSVAAIAPGMARADDYTFTGGASVTPLDSGTAYDWAVASNWHDDTTGTIAAHYPGQSATDADTVTIPATVASATPKLDISNSAGDVVLADLTINGTNVHTPTITDADNGDETQGLEVDSALEATNATFDQIELDLERAATATFSGTVSVTGGADYFAPGTTHLVSGATLNITGSTLDTAPASTLSGDGTIDFTSGSPTTLHGTVAPGDSSSDAPGTLTFTGESVTLADDSTVSIGVYGLDDSDNSAVAFNGGAALAGELVLDTDAFASTSESEQNFPTGNHLAPITSTGTLTGDFSFVSTSNDSAPFTGLYFSGVRTAHAYTVTSGRIAASVTSDFPVAGGSFGVSGSGFPAGDSVEFYLSGGTIQGGNLQPDGVAGADGSFSASVPVPAGTPAGTYELVVVDTDHGGAVDLTVHVAAPPAPAPAPAGPAPATAPATAPPPANIPPVTLGTPVSVTVSATAAVTTEVSSDGATGILTVPAGALPAGTTVSVYPVAASAAAKAHAPANGSFLSAFVVSWVAPDGTSPTATKPISLTVNDSSIKIGDTVSQITSTGMRVVGTAVKNGTVTITFNSDPLFVLAAQPTLTVHGAGSVKGSLVRLSLTCRAGTRCKGSAALTATSRVKVGKHSVVRTTIIARGTIRLSTTKRTVVSLHLTRAGKTMLAKAKNHLRGQLVFTVKGSPKSLRAVTIR